MEFVSADGERRLKEFAQPYTRHDDNAVFVYYDRLAQTEFPIEASGARSPVKLFGFPSRGRGMLEIWRLLIYASPGRTALHRPD